MDLDPSFGTVFPLAAVYRDRTRPTPAVRDTGTPAPTFPYTERHLQCAWADRVWQPQPLLTLEGETVTVVDPGRWNLEEGPDFLDAVLQIGPDHRQLVGDVEVHVSAADWVSHGHADDSRYARVVAHATWHPTAALPDGILPPGTVQLALRDPVAGNPRFHFEDIDLTAYPFATIRADPPCRLALDAAGQDAREALLDAAGHERFRRKAARFAMACRADTLEQVLYAGTLAALGYKKNALAFRSLAQRLPAATLRSESDGDPMRAYALLLGVAGLLPAQPPPDADQATRLFIRGLWDHWWRWRARWESRALRPETWCFAGLRPHNAPVRRLAAAATLFADNVPLHERIPSPDAIEPGTWIKQAVHLLEAGDALPYWQHRLGLGGAVQKSRVSLVGKRRAITIVSNVLIPCLAATGHPVKPLLTALPSEETNALVRQAAFSLFGRDHNETLYASALRQQGLLQIFYDFCLVNRNGCTQCALADALSGP